MARGAARLDRRRRAVRERARPAPHHRRDPPRGRRRHRLAHRFATPGRRQDRRGDDRDAGRRQRRAGPEAEDGGRSFGPQADGQVERASPLRPSLVPHHRAARRRQDDGAGEFGPQVSARRGQRRDRGPGRRRHALLRLVVHRRSGADRHRRPLHHAGFGRQGRSPQLARLSRHAGPQPSPAADQRRDRRDQHRRRSQPAAEGGRGARRRDPQAPRRTARGAEGRLPGLCGLHQNGSGRGLHPVFRRSRRGEAAGGLGRHVPDLRQEGQQRRQGLRGDRPPHSARLGEDARTAAGGARPADRGRSCSAFRRSSARIRKPIADFLNRIFEPTRYQTTAVLRGFYFTSGTQEGTPFDAVIGALQKSYGVQSLGAVGFSGDRQKLLPARPHGEGDLRRGRMGFDQHRRRAQVARAQSGGVRLDRPRNRGRPRLVVDELHAQRRAHRRDRAGRQRLRIDRRTLHQAEFGHRSESFAHL